MLIDTIAPDIRRSLSLARELSPGGAANFALLEDNRHAIFMLREDGCVVFMNRAAHQFIESDEVLTVARNEKLLSRSTGLDGYLAELVRAVTQGKAAATPASIAVRTRTHRPCVLHTHLFPRGADHVFPLTASADSVAGALIVAGQFSTARTEDFATVLRAHGATAAETRLGQAVCDGLPLQDYAQRHALSLYTVRNQMRVLLHKTGSRNQADFMRHLHLQLSSFKATQRGAH